MIDCKKEKLRALHQVYIGKYLFGDSIYFVLVDLDKFNLVMDLPVQFYFIMELFTLTI